jgi:hypothetical protein
MLGGPHGHAGVPDDEPLRVGGQVTVHMKSMLLMCNFLVFINTSADPPEAKNSPNFFKKRLFCALFDVFMVHPAQSLETIRALVASCYYIFIGTFLFVFVLASKKS